MSHCFLLIPTPYSGFQYWPRETRCLIHGIHAILEKTYNRSGEWAAGGKFLPDLLEGFKSVPYFSEPIPKTAGPEYFGRAWLEARLQMKSESVAAAHSGNTYRVHSRKYC